MTYELFFKKNMGPIGSSDFREFEVGIDKSSMANDAKFTVTSFFAGCGGLDLGFLGGFEYRQEAFSRTNFSIDMAYEYDKFCAETYRLNVGEHFCLADLSNHDVSSAPKSDVLIGGFPCQEFSICGPRRGLESERGQLYKALVDYCRVHQPKLFVAENVSHIASMAKGKVLEKIKSEFEGVGYKVIVWNLYAPDYGVPQMRSRVFIIGIRNDLPGEPEPPVALYSQDHRSVRWAISDLENVFDETIPNQSQYFKANKAKNGHGQGDETSQRDMPGYTVRANAKSRVQFHYALPRRLTIRECARLQTFPDSFVFPHAPTRSISQIGNAVPPVLGYVVARQIEIYLEKINSIMTESDVKNIAA